MKLYIVTADDIEDHYPIAVFDTKDAAEAMVSRMKSEKKESYAKMSRDRAERDNVPDMFVWEDRMFYSDVVELDLNQDDDDELREDVEISMLWLTHGQTPTLEKSVIDCVIGLVKKYRNKS